MAITYLFFKKTQRYLPPVLRGTIGLVLVAMGLLGFLPVLGFWMIPLGLAVLATDIPPLKRRLHGRLRHQRRRNLRL
ncbi:MAG: hypothetical protein H7A04_08660 [Pseudomonadales bacterium]|nr:hypothetical protein [Pseudomonadales bacterium]